MSNTDGEDTQRIEKEAIAFADSIEVNSIATHTWLVKGYIAGAKELASLREQHLFERASREGFIKRLEQQLKQKEDENRELKRCIKDLIVVATEYVKGEKRINKSSLSIIIDDAKKAL